MVSSRPCSECRESGSNARKDSLPIQNPYQNTNESCFVFAGEFQPIYIKFTRILYVSFFKKDIFLSSFKRQFNLKEF